MTLVELMVVLAIIAILATVAIAYSGEHKGTSRSFADDLVAEADAARLRAISTRRWNRMWFDFTEEKVVVEESTTLGMAVPADDEWQVIEKLELPRMVHIAAITTTSDVDAGNDVTDGSGLDEVISFAPDGSSASRTIYLEPSSAEGGEQRVVFYRATGSGYRKDGW